MLQFTENEFIEVVKVGTRGWFQGILNGSKGWFPAKYVKKAEQVINLLIQVLSLINNLSHDLIA